MTLEELESRRAMRFVSVQKGVEKEGFALFFEGQIKAYENRCQHLPLPLDYGNGPFFDPEGRHLVCHNHGAVFDPLTGLCLQGPCVGTSLAEFRVEIVAGEVCPADQDAS